MSNENLLRQTEVPVPPAEIIDHGEGEINDKIGAMGKKPVDLAMEWSDKLKFPHELGGFS